MTDNTKYWVWLSLALGTNSAKHKRVYELYNSIKEFYDYGIYEWRLCGFLSEKEIDKLSKTSLSDATKVIEKCKSLGYDIVCIEDDLYPKKLKDIYNPPSVCMFGESCLLLMINSA